MATEAQRLIGISLAKIAQSRCGRGGCSLHKNLLVATVLQKARYIFMEEAFHMVHGHYINQQNSKLIEQQQQLLMQHHHQKMLQMQRQEELEHELRQHDKATTFVNDNDSSLDDSELDIFSSSSIETNDGLEFLNHTQTTESTTTTTQVAIGNNDDSNNKQAPGHSEYFVNNKENNPPSASTSSSSSLSLSTSSSSLLLSSATTTTTTTTQSTELVYLDLDVNKVKSSSAIVVDQHHVDVDSNSGRSSTSISGNKRPLNVSEWETEEAILSILPKAKQIKYSDSEPSDEDDDETSNSDLTLDFLSNDLHLTNKSPTKTNMMTMTPLDMSNNNNNNNSNTSASLTQPQSTSTSTAPTPSSSSIERITSLVSIFNMSNFGNLQRSVSNPDLCSSSSHSADGNCCLTTQRQYLAMAV